MKINKKRIVFVLLILLALSHTLTQSTPFDYSFKNNEEKIIFADQDILKQHVSTLSSDGRTNAKERAKAVTYIKRTLKNDGISENSIELQKYIIDESEHQNIIVHFGFNKSKLEKERIPLYIIGAHYDSYGSMPGANDNASGVAGLLEIARILQKTSLLQKEIDLVFYSTEEPPYFSSKEMGSFVHAKNLKNKNRVELVLILETIGYFSEDEDSQKYPNPILNLLYPNTGNFIGVVSNLSNLSEVRDVKKRFKSFLKENNIIEVESISAPSLLAGIDFSDHRNYWKYDIPAIMITDTAFYRYKYYHTDGDTSEKLNYVKMKDVIDATVFTILSL
jgi:hypothetical protein